MMVLSYNQAIISIPNGKSICINNNNNSCNNKAIYDELEERLSYLSTIDYYLADLSGHILLREDDIETCSSNVQQHQSSLPLLLLDLIYRCPGGKGGFGSQLRAQGGRMASKKSTNFEACRDLSGRRLKTVNDAKQLAEYMSKQPDRDREKQGKMQKKIDDGLKARQKIVNGNRTNQGPALSQEYVETLEKVGMDIKDAVAKAIKNSNGSSSSKPMTAAVIAPKPIVKKIWGLDDDDEDDDDESVSEFSIDIKSKGKATVKHNDTGFDE